MLYSVVRACDRPAALLLGSVVVLALSAAAEAKPGALEQFAPEGEENNLGLLEDELLRERELETQLSEDEEEAEDIAKFLDHYVLIKTPHGYMIGENANTPRPTKLPKSFGQRRQRRMPSFGGSDSNFQLRVRKAMPFGSKGSNFQLRVRKGFPTAERNFQLRVRKGFPTAERNFQLRVRKGFPSDRNFQLRVRKGFPSADRNFQLRVRKPFPSGESNFQLRVRKRAAPDHNFQLRVRKDAEGPHAAAIQAFLDRYGLLKTSDGAYMVDHQQGKRDAENFDGEEAPSAAQADDEEE